MKNIQENIYRVKSLMNLLVEDDVTPNTQIPKLDPETLSKDYPVFLKDESLNILEDNKYYLGGKWDFHNGNFRNGQQRITYYKDEILIITIDFLVRNDMPGSTPWSEIFNVLNTATIENRNNFGEEAKSTLDILLKDYIKNITLIHLYIDKYKKIESITIHVKNNNNEKFSFSIYDNGPLVDDFENNLYSKVENGKIILTSTDGKVLDFEPNKQTTEPTTTPTEPTTTPTEPTTTPTEPAPTVEEVKYPTDTNFSSLPDDIYQDLILNKIPNVKIKSSSNQKLSSDNKTLESIDFILDIDNVEFSANFSKSGLKLINKATNKQVKPLWTDKELKYRNFNQTEKKTDNEWMKTQVQLKLESYMNRFKQLI